MLRKFLTAAASQNALLRAIRRFTWAVRIVQTKVKAWLKSIHGQQMEIAENWIICEESEVKRTWASADRKIIQAERDRLMGIRSAKDKENVERLITLTKTNMKRYLHPKTDADFMIVRTMLDRALLPLGLRNMTIAQIFQRKRSLYKKSMFMYSQDVEAFNRATTTWIDIDQAIRMIDPSGCNPAPKPRPPLQPRLSTKIEYDCLRRVVIRVTRWYEDNQKGLQEFLDSQQSLSAEQRWRQAFAVISGKVQDMHDTVLQPIADIVTDEVDPENLLQKRNAQILDTNVISLATKMHEQTLEKKANKARPASAPPGRSAAKLQANEVGKEEGRSSAEIVPKSASRPTSAVQSKAGTTVRAKGMASLTKVGSSRGRLI